MLSRRLFLTLCSALLATPSLAETVQLPEGMTLIILRHADREGEELTAKGIARSEALVKALEGIKIDRIFAPSIQRNLDTAEPLATNRGLPIERLPSGNPVPGLMEAGENKTIVWVGNKGNLRAIWTAIGAADPAPLEYGDLFFVTPGPNVERKRVEP